MNKLIYTLIVTICFSTSIFSQSPKVFFKEGIVYIKNSGLEIKDTTIDGKYFKYPKNWNLRKGADNEYICYPDSWIINEGKDGRLVAFPKDWLAIESPDGRIVPLLYKEKIVNYKEKKKDCIVSESDDCMVNIKKSTNEYGLYTRVGDDGRVILYTKDMNVASSPDGRLVNLPKGWEVSQSAKNRFIAYPKNWEAFILEKDKEIAMPKNWTIDVQTNSPKIISTNGLIKFIYSPVQQIKIAEAIYNADKVNGLNYILYLLFNQE